MMTLLLPMKAAALVVTLVAQPAASCSAPNEKLKELVRGSVAAT
jgi:hypothetical protein